MELDYNIHSKSIDFGFIRTRELMMHLQSQIALIFKTSILPELISYARCSLLGLSRQGEAKDKE